MHNRPLMFYEVLIFNGVLLSFGSGTIDKTLLVILAFSLFLSADVNMVSGLQHEQLQNTDNLQSFPELLINHQSRINNQPIRGPDAFAWDYYQQSGGIEQNAFFLFGRASQHRN